MSNRKPTSFWVANGSTSKIQVKSDTHQLELSKLQIDMGCKVSGRAAFEFAGQGAAADAGFSRDRREEYQRKFIEHGFVPVGVGKFLPFEGDYVMICDLEGKPICGNYKVKANCSVIVMRDKTIQVSAPIKKDWKGKLDDTKLWRSFDGSFHYIHPSEEKKDDFRQSSYEMEDNDRYSEDEEEEEDAYDEYDARASIGVRHPNVTCDECSQQGIVGARWKCSECYNYDLCSTCYVTNRHDVTHRFLRYDTPTSEGVPVEPRKKPQAVQPAKVQRHLHITCDECNERGIAGIRWKCRDCYDYDLCSSCYNANRHDVTHRFIRFDTPNSDGTPVEPRKKPTAVQPSRNTRSKAPQCKALYDYDAYEDEELSFVEGDVMKLLRDLGENWLMVELNGRKGLIPENYVEIINPLPPDNSDDDAAVIRELFKLFDHNNRGYLKANDVKRILALVDVKMTNKELNEFIRDADVDGDGKIDCEEFISLMLQMED